MIGCEFSELMSIREIEQIEVRVGISEQIIKLIDSEESYKILSTVIKTQICCLLVLIPTK